jgi:hypothetical protein
MARRTQEKRPSSPPADPLGHRLARRAILTKIARLALLYAADGRPLEPLRRYRQEIEAGRVPPPCGFEEPEERWVFQAGTRRFDEAAVDAELAQLSLERLS